MTIFIPATCKLSQNTVQSFRSFLKIAEPLRQNKNCMALFSLSQAVEILTPRESDKPVGKTLQITFTHITMDAEMLCVLFSAVFEHSMDLMVTAPPTQIRMQIVHRNEFV
jgi:hypothetical protein